MRLVTTDAELEAAARDSTLAWHDARLAPLPWGLRDLANTHFVALFKTREDLLERAPRALIIEAPWK